VRRSSRQLDEVEVLGGGALSPLPTPEVVIEVCTCGCTPQDDGTAAHPDWPLAMAWQFLTRPVHAEPLVVDDLGDDLVDDVESADDETAEDVDPASLPWWDARATATRRRAVLPLVLLGELQVGVLLRALWEVAQGPSGPMA
jgi:hypothetical protein